MSSKPGAPSTTVSAGTGMPPGFVRFWTGQTLAQFGTRLASVAMPVVAVQYLHAGATDLGRLNAAGTAAFLLVGLPAGALVDRWLKRRTMVVADLVRLLAAFCVPLLWLTGHLQLWQLYLVAGVVGVASVFFDVAYQSYIPILMPDGQVGLANARLEATAELATTGGPALGGLLMKVLAAPVVMLADALGYACSLAFLLTVRDDEATARADTPRPASTIPADIREGLAYVWHQPAIRGITACTGLSNLFATIVSTVLPLLVLDRLGLDGFTLGLVLTCGSAGGALGAWATPRLRRRLTTSRLVVLACMTATACYLGNPVAALLGPGHRGAAAVLLCLAEAGTMAAVLAYNITQVSLRQTLCPRELLGRMNASIRFVVWGIMPLAALLAGWLGSRLGVTATTWIGGLGSLVAVLPVLGLGRHVPDELEAVTA